MHFSYKIVYLKIEDQLLKGRLKQLAMAAQGYQGIGRWPQAYMGARGCESALRVIILLFA